MSPSSRPSVCLLIYLSIRSHQMSVRFIHSCPKGKGQDVLAKEENGDLLCLITLASRLLLKFGYGKTLQAIMLLKMFAST